MALILSLETATRACSVALAQDGRVISVRSSMAENSHSALLTVYIEEILKEQNLALSSVDAFAVSKGPGSYTGLRIGVSVAKGLCYGLTKPLIAVDTLQAMAAFFSPDKNYQDFLFCPMIDARRMEVYTAIYDSGLNELMPVSAEIITEQSFAEFLSEQKVLFFGDGAPKCMELLSKHPNAVFNCDFINTAETVASLAEKAFIRKTFEDVAYFEPFYLKDFVAGKPRVKGLQ